MGNYLSYKSLDDEKRKLRVQNALLQRHLVTVRKRREEAENKANEWQKKYNEQQQEINKPQEELEKVRKQRDTYRDMLFKANRKKDVPEEPVSLFGTLRKRQPGGQSGHKGYGRTTPERIDKQLHVFANQCPTCKGKRNRATTTVSHTVEDIPALHQQQTVVTRYAVEKQWCRNCKKEITVTPKGVIPGSRLGLNLIMQVLLWKYMYVPYSPQYHRYHA